MPELCPAKEFRILGVPARVPVAILVLFSLAVGFLTLPQFARKAEAATSELFFSEYIEGSGFNKALEIYNGTGTAAPLTGYTVEMYFNGSSTAGLTLTLNGSIADGDVYVIANTNATT